MTSSIDGLMIALLSLLLATCTLVTTLGLRAFPGWTGAGTARWVRSGVLVMTSTYVILTASVLYGIGSVRAAGGAATTGDAEAALRILVLGLGTVLVLWVLALRTPRSDAPREPVSTATPWWAGIAMLVLGVYTADGVINLLYEPTGIAILVGLMVALGVAFDAFAATGHRRTARQARARLARAMRRIRREAGGVLVRCALEDDGHDEQHQIATATTTVARDAVWLQIPEARELATWLRTRPPCAAGAYADARLHDSWLNGASLTLKRGEKPLREERQAPEHGQWRGYPVGLIKVPTDALLAAGVRVTV